MKHQYGPGIIAAALIVCAGAAAAQTDGEIVVPLSDPSRPVVLEVSAMRGSVTVTAYDGEQVLVAPLDTPERVDRRIDPVAADGLRRIPNSSLELLVEEAANTVTVRISSGADSAGVRVSVPRNTSVIARTVNDGDVIVEGVSGEHELSNVNGGITATDISGSAVVNTTNGDVTVSLVELTPDKAMSFTSFNGDVEVSLPAGLAADLHITTNRGDILTDLDVDVLPQETIVERSEDGSRYQVRIESEVRATVGGGGPEMRFKTFNGDIVIRGR